MMELAKRLGPASVPEDIMARIKDGKVLPPPGGKVVHHGEWFKREDGRIFEMMPRVMKPVDDRYGLVFFHSSDNPYGNPLSVLDKVRGKSVVYIKERFCGMANKTIGSVFTKFNDEVHVVPASAIPGRGTNYFIMDPCGTRNFFMLWIRWVRDCVYVYREWPGNYYVPGVGVPGLWALPDGSGKKMDGRKGPGQASFGFGLLRYKMEIARLEGWADYNKRLSGKEKDKLVEEQKKKAAVLGCVLDEVSDRDLELLGVAQWSPGHGTKEVIDGNCAAGRLG